VSVHVWIVGLAGTRDGDLELLAPDERERARSFAFDRDRRRYTRRRAALRRVLSQYLKVPACALELAYGPHGAPSVRRPRTDVAFSVAHSGDLGLIAVTRDRRIGVDIERRREDLDACGVAVSAFHPGEQSRLRTRPHEFFAYWTAKEAYVKALGTGLHKPLDEFEVDVRADGRLTLLADRGRQMPDWTLQALHVSPGYTAALAVSRRCCRR